MPAYNMECLRVDLTQGYNINSTVTFFTQKSGTIIHVTYVITVMFTYNLEGLSCNNRAMSVCSFFTLNNVFILHSVSHESTQCICSETTLQHILYILNLNTLVPFIAHCGIILDCEKKDT